jgi:hypothetical protein
LLLGLVAPAQDAIEFVVSYLDVVTQALYASDKRFTGNVIGPRCLRLGGQRVNEGENLPELI